MRNKMSMKKNIMINKEKEDKEKKKKVFNWIINILLIILLILGMYLFFTRIFGNSPTDFQLILWLLGFFVTAMLKIYSLIYGLNREVGELKTGIKDSFKKIKSDTDDFKGELNIVMKDIQNIKKLLKKNVRK